MFDYYHKNYFLIFEALTLDFLIFKKKKDFRKTT